MEPFLEKQWTHIRDLSKTGVGTWSLEVNVWFKWGTTDMMEWDVPGTAEFECVQRNEPSLLNPTLTRGRGCDSIHDA